MKITMRQSGLFVMGLQFVGVSLLLLLQLLTVAPTAYTVLMGVGALLLGGCWFAYWRGWQQARPIVVFIITAMIAFGIQEPYVTQIVPLSILLPPILAMILTGATGVVASALSMLVVLIIRAGGQGIYTDPVNLVLFVMIIGGMVLSRLVADAARTTAEDNAHRAEQASAESASRANDLAEANTLMERQLEQQDQLLRLVTTLETPTLALADGVLIAPIVGHIDTRRAEAITQRLLAAASAQHAKLVIIDIAGVTVMDTAVAKAVLNTTQALRLLGCRVALSGISARVAITLTDQGVSLAGIATARSPQEALASWLAQTQLPASEHASARNGN